MILLIGEDSSISWTFLLQYLFFDTYNMKSIYFSCTLRKFRREFQDLIEYLVLIYIFILYNHILCIFLIKRLRLYFGSK